MATPTPNGCRHDGIDQRTHARQWTPNAGWHTWEKPTPEQIKDRMHARRVNRKEIRPVLPIHHICEGDDDGCDICQPEPETATS